MLVKGTAHSQKDAQHPAWRIRMNRKSFILAAALGLAVSPMLAHADDDEASVAERAGQHAADAALTTRVKAAFAAEPQINTLDITVESSDGVVTLSGDVDSSAQAALAEEIVSDIDGVQSVHNALEADDS